MPESPTVKTLISIGPDIPEGFHDWMKEWNECAPFVRPEHVNSNEDTLLMYFTSGTTGEPKMVAHDHLYALGHLTTGVYWHNLHENSIIARHNATAPHAEHGDPHRKPGIARPFQPGRKYPGRGPNWHKRRVEPNEHLHDLFHVIFMRIERGHQPGKRRSSPRNRRQSNS